MIIKAFSIYNIEVFLIDFYYFRLIMEYSVVYWHLFIYYQVLKENELVIILYTSYSLFISFILNYITFYFK